MTVTTLRMHNSFIDKTFKSFNCSIIDFLRDDKQKRHTQRLELFILHDLFIVILIMSHSNRSSSSKIDTIEPLQCLDKYQVFALSLNANQLTLVFSARFVFQ